MRLLILHCGAWLLKLFSIYDKDLISFLNTLPTTCTDATMSGARRGLVVNRVLHEPDITESELRSVCGYMLICESNCRYLTEYMSGVYLIFASRFVICRVRKIACFSAFGMEVVAWRMWSFSRLLSYCWCAAHCDFYFVWICIDNHSKWLLEC